MIHLIKQSIIIPALGTSIVIAASILLRRLIWPTILTYPWTLAQSKNQRENDKKKIVVLAGSYNPPHYGHLEMLKFLAKRYGTVIAVIGVNPNKTYVVTPQERADMIKAMLDSAGIKDQVRVQVVEGYIWRFAMKENVSIMFRGIRSWSKDGKEEQALHILNTWGPLVYGPFKWPLPTQYLEGAPEYNHISSTLIRTLCMKAGTGKDPDLTSVVPHNAASLVAEAYCRSSLS